VSNGLPIAPGGATFNFPPNLFHWTGGNVAGGALTNVGSLAVSGSSSKILGTTINNQGTITYTGSNWVFGSGDYSPGILNNLPGGLFVADGDSDVQPNFSPPNQGFNNQGTVRHTGVGTTTFGVPFNALGGTAAPSMF
jgi:hypothetical protein